MLAIPANGVFRAEEQVHEHGVLLGSEVLRRGGEPAREVEHAGDGAGFFLSEPPREAARTSRESWTRRLAAKGCWRLAGRRRGSRASASAVRRSLRAGPPGRARAPRRCRGDRARPAADPRRGTGRAVCRPARRTAPAGCGRGKELGLPFAVPRVEVGHVALQHEERLDADEVLQLALPGRHVHGATPSRGSFGAGRGCRWISPGRRTPAFCTGARFLHLLMIQGFQCRIEHDDRWLVEPRSAQTPSFSAST